MENYKAGNVDFTGKYYSINFEKIAFVRHNKKRKTINKNKKRKIDK